MISDTDIQLWWLALGLGLVVVLVVAVLLELVVRTAHRIHQAVSDIWTGGTHIAQNTVTLALLQRTNYLARALLQSAGRIAAASGRIREATGRAP
jgi:uncharacterized membrane protein